MNKNCTILWKLDEICQACSEREKNLNIELKDYAKYFLIISDYHIFDTRIKTNDLQSNLHLHLRNLRLRASWKNSICRFGDRWIFLQWPNNSENTSWTLRTIFLSGTQTESKFSTKYSFTNFKVSIEDLKEQSKPLVTGEHECEYWQKSTLIALLKCFLSRLLKKLQDRKYFASTSLLNV